MKLAMSSFGFVVTRQAPADGYHKVLITGLGRSGTSALASMLRNAGFYLGEVEEVATREDPTLRDMLSKGQIKEIQALLAQRAGSYPLIAWKDPKLLGKQGIELVSSLSDDWAVIAVFRDPLAVTMRRVADEGGDVIKTLLDAVRLQTKLIRLAEATQKTTLLVSYEKLMASPTEVCRDLLDVLDPTLTASLDFAALWQKTKADQEMYRAHAERKRQ